MRAAPNVAELRHAARGEPLPTRFDQLGESRFRLILPGVVELEIDFLRREAGQLKGELLVRTTLPGVRTVDGVLAVTDCNLSGARSRQGVAKYLAERARVAELDWESLVEELAQRVLAAERQGPPAIVLADLPRPAPDQTLEVDRVTLLARHPVILFGDGGTAKSLLALYLGGTLAQRGHRVGFFDWELSADDHRDRLERIFGPTMPRIVYARCARSFVHEGERLRRIVRDEGLDFVIFDSIAFACDGPPEAAEVAGRYFQALRGLGPVGSLHVAHVTKAFDGADQRPFGSTFWHNGARATWNVKLAEAEPGDSLLEIALHNRKSNLSGRQRSVGFELRFAEDRTVIRPVDPAGVPGLVTGLSLPQRILAAVRSGPLSRQQLAAELEDVSPETLRRTINRQLGSGRLLKLPGPAGADEKLALPHRGPAPTPGQTVPGHRDTTSRAGAGHTTPSRGVCPDPARGDSGSTEATVERARL